MWVDVETASLTADDMAKVDAYQMWVAVETASLTADDMAKESNSIFKPYLRKHLPATINANADSLESIDK